MVRKIDDCIEKSFVDPKNKFGSNNLLLEKHANKSPFLELYHVPAFLINNQFVRENLKEDVILSAMCEELEQKPEVCSNFGEVEIKFKSEKEVQKNLLLVFAVMLPSVFLFLLAVVLLKHFLKRKVQEELNSDVEKHVSMYIRIQNLSEE